MDMACARRRAGLLQRQVAEALNVSMGTVAMWDTGRNKPRADMLPKIAKLYGVTVDELLSGDADPQRGPQKEAADG
ncbi:helix-turn-helix domain-containing protein [uncultured Dysosmobacter sp.]|uniref:helix-turn-helix domain-containing protein n=1 Tax=uncultured Dysosmobacter sp. TaxID=2591384 RepID=UPI0026375790|nr:helix-turn-helix transcriptional regulator [uncultured Dysosmobacter sp.]